MINRDKKSEQKTLSNIEQLPREIAVELISYLPKDICNLRQTSKTMHTLFKAPFDDVNKLLYFVKEANYIEAEKMVANNPQLIFGLSKFKKPDGTLETTTPLKLAFKLLDTYMWKMFFEKIKNNSDFVKCFANQLHEQTDYVDLNPLFDRYDAYIKISTPWAEDEARNNFRWAANELFTSEEDIYPVWLKLGEKQHDLLPRHMLKEFCREGNSWKAESQFDTDKNPPPGPACAILEYFPRQKIKPLFPQLSELGTKFALTRGKDNSNASFTGPMNMGNRSQISEIGKRAPHDVDVFKQLHKVRINDLAKLRKRMDSQLYQAFDTAKNLCEKFLKKIR